MIRIRYTFNRKKKRIVINLKQYTIQSYIEDLQKENLLIDTINCDEILDCMVRDMSYNSKEVRQDCLFVCKGFGNNFKQEYLEEAIRQGAICYVSSQEYNVGIPCILVKDGFLALGVLARRYFNHPQEHLNVIGITGTKGKSTTSYYVKYILDEYMKVKGKKDTAILSSIDVYDGVSQYESHLTTPESYDIHRHFANAVTSKIENIVMEVSSQSLKLGRVNSIAFDIGVFLNISEDHISDIEHPNFDDYLDSKLKLFERSKIACVNLNTDYLERVLKASKKSENVITFGTTENADVYGYNIQKDGFHTKFMVRTPYFEKEMLLTMSGLFNVENALAAISVAVALKVPYECIYQGLKKAKASGRMEVYADKNKKVIVIVDYAHNKLSFEKLYESTIKEFPQREIVTVFGCPGGHAVNRRKDLGELSGKYSDISYLTTEDPREEDPVAICKEISMHIKKVNGKYKIVEDRGEAIKQAIFEAKPNSVILITGKGNETRQKIGTKFVKCPTDVQYVKKYLREYDKESKGKVSKK